MSRKGRAIVLVLDGLGIGALPDAREYGDRDADTLGHLCQAVPGLRLPHLEHMGLGHLGRFAGIPPHERPTASYGRLAEVSAGKDTITGHWELMGLVTHTPFPTYPEGFPSEVIRAFEAAVGRKVLWNRPASGTEIILRLGEEHLRTGRPIVYTSADSVFQIAAHESVIPPRELYEICRLARRLLVPPHGVARVIARPFTGTPGRFTRTSGRHDFALPPPGKTLLHLYKEQKREVVGVGKIPEIFAGSGVTRSLTAAHNAEALDRTLEALSATSDALILVNLVDFDMLYGHRNDATGYADALRAFDQRLPQVLASLRRDDLLVITADHGCDPTTPGTDHTREYVPLLIQGPGIRRAVDLGVRSSMADLAATLAAWFQVPGHLEGRSFGDRIRS